MTEQPGHQTESAFARAVSKNKIKARQRLACVLVVCVISIVAYLSVLQGEKRKKPVVENNEVVYSLMPDSADQEAFSAKYESRLQRIDDELEAMQLKNDKSLEESERRLHNIEDSILSMTKSIEQQSKVELVETHAAPAFDELETTEATAQENSLVMITLTDEIKQPTKVKSNDVGISELAAPQILHPPALRADDAIHVNRAKGKNANDYIPAGSFVKATVLSGVFAGTGPEAPSVPTPVLMRVDGFLTMPNKWKSQLNDCFLLGNATGELSSERVLIRLERLSCVRNNAAVIDLRVRGLVTGEDGKVGIRGRLINRNGKALASALGVGVLSGLGEAISLGAREVTSENGSTTINYHNPFKAGIGKGANESMNQLTRYYLKLAERIFPVLEIDAGRKVDVIFTQGLLLEN